MQEPWCPTRAEGMASIMSGAVAVVLCDVYLKNKGLAIFAAPIVVMAILGSATLVITMLRFEKPLE
jgi:hypothetical protein